MHCKIPDCPHDADIETELCEFHASLVALCRTNMELAKGQPPPKRTGRCYRCRAKLGAVSERVGFWMFYCPNGCEYCEDCRKFIDYRTRCQHGVPELAY
jgi:hypothetical protein